MQLSELKIRYMRRRNLGNYQHDEAEVSKTFSSVDGDDSFPNIEEESITIKSQTMELLGMTPEQEASTEVTQELIDKAKAGRATKKPIATANAKLDTLHTRAKERINGSTSSVMLKQAVRDIGASYEKCFSTDGERMAVYDEIIEMALEHAKQFDDDAALEGYIMGMSREALTQ